MKSSLSHIMFRQGGFFMRSVMWKRYKKGKKLVESVNIFLCFVLVFGVIPVLITTFFQRIELEDLIAKAPNNSISEIEILLPQIVAKQIGMQQPDEVIKAQCVIARTNLMAARQKGETGPASFSMEELQNLWGNQFESYYERLQALVEETAGQTLQYDNRFIYAAYHQISAGNTRNMKEYHSGSLMSYLKEVDCHEDTTAQGYLNVYFWTKEEFLKVCKMVFPKECISSGDEVVIQKRDGASYVLEVKVGQTIYEGEEFRKKLNLPSSCFELTLLDENVRIVTLGSGHGFGLSQHMAGVLAERGYDYKKILEYFFDDAVLSVMS